MFLMGEIEISSESPEADSNKIPESANPVRSDIWTQAYLIRNVIAA